MAQYKQSEITNVFWASNDGFKGGRDPLGIQNSSIATYSKLLPGLTNLTRHIRYYSLYCWLLSEYDKLEVAGQISLHQYNFIRRAELAMALIMKEQNVGSVVGALFVSQGRYKQIEDGIYDQEANNQLKCTALVTSGKFYSANTAAELMHSLKQSLNAQKEVQGVIITH